MTNYKGANGFFMKNGKSRNLTADLVPEYSQIKKIKFQESTKGKLYISINLLHNKIVIKHIAK